MATSVFDIIGIGFRVVSHRAEIMQMYDRIVPLIRNATAAYADVKILVEKIAPGILKETITVTVSAAIEPFSVEWLQDSLNKLSGAGLVVDGDYGPATRAAVENFQKRLGLEVDGWAGVNTSSAIFAELEKLKR